MLFQSRRVWQMRLRPVPKKGLRWIVLLAAVWLGVAPLASQAESGQTNSIVNLNTKQFRYVDTTGHSMIGPVLRFYERSGGLERHGLPLSEMIRFKNHYIQYFERSVLEFYPAYDGTDQAIQLEPVGQLAAQTAKVDTSPITPFVGTATRWYFPDTGHSLEGSFLNYWRNAGDQANLGRPISERFSEGDLNVQYFENARLEQPAEDDKAPITLSLLGSLQAHRQLTPAQLTPIAKERFLAPRTIKVPSLMFHYVREVDKRKDPLGYDLSIKPDNYVKFLDWTVQNGYNTVTVDQIADYIKYGILLPDRPVNFRWDDGHDCDWFAYQEMKKRGMTATFYVISRKLELTPAQWEQIDADGFEVAAHTRTHPDLKGVSDLTNEIAGSKTDMEAMLGHPVLDFAYPYGSYTDRIKQAVRNSGFQIATTTHGGYTWNGDNMLEQPTVSVTGEDTLESFAAKITAAGAPPAPIQQHQAAVNPSPATQAAQPTAIQKTAPAQPTPKK